MPPKKEKPPAKDHFPDVMVFLFFVAFIGAAWYRLQVYFNYESLSALWASIVAFFAHRVWPVVKVLAVFVSFAALWGVVVFMRKLRKLSAEDALIFHDNENKNTIDKEVKNTKWEKILVQINSVNSSDWRQAIIEADVMLDEVLRACNYHGDSIGDMLKSVEPSDMLTLDAAWEAHKIRNRIAHDGSDFELTERDAKNTVLQYESVFKEFKII